MNEVTKIENKVIMNKFQKKAIFYLQQKETDDKTGGDTNG